MTDLTATELELLTFFEVLPRLRDQDVPWIYNDALYELGQGDLSMSFAVAPAYKDIRIVLSQGDVVIYELNAMAIQDLRYVEDQRGEILEIEVSKTDRLTLKVNPAISLLQTVKNPDRLGAIRSNKALSRPLFGRRGRPLLPRRRVFFGPRPQGTGGFADRLSSGGCLA